MLYSNVTRSNGNNLVCVCIYIYLYTESNFLQPISISRHIQYRWALLILGDPNTATLRAARFVPATAAPSLRHSSHASVLHLFDQWQNETEKIKGKTMKMRLGRPIGLLITKSFCITIWISKQAPSIANWLRAKPKNAWNKVEMMSKGLYTNDSLMKWIVQVSWWSWYTDFWCCSYCWWTKSCTTWDV